jgi:hypothetical protein
VVKSYRAVSYGAMPCRADVSCQSGLSYREAVLASFSGVAVVSLSVVRDRRAFALRADIMRASSALVSS